MKDTLDYRNTAEGKAVQRKYKDILYSSRPELPPGHPRMDIHNRAKIFSPFAALRGYEEEIQSEGRDHLKGSRVELSEGEQEKLSEQLQKVTKGMRVAIRYFKDGFYEDIEGVVTCMDPIKQVVCLQAAEAGALEKDIPVEIAFRDILCIKAGEN